MNISPVEIIGFVATCLTTSSFLPQTIKILRTKDTKSISLLMYSIFTAGVSLWAFYGYVIGSPSVMFANLITLVFAVVILILKIKHG